MKRLIRSLGMASLAMLAGSGLDVAAASILASATRTTAFASTSKSEVPVPLTNNGVTELLFTTTIKNQIVKITYNAECVVTGTRGMWVSVRILVNGNEADPASGHDFALCTAFDKTGKTWAARTRQSVFKVPAAGMHTVKVVARLNGAPLGSGTWRLDDSSLVVETGIIKHATRTEAFESTSGSAVNVPLKQNGGKTLAFDTSAENQRVVITYNAECIVTGSVAQGALIWFKIDGFGVNPGNSSLTLCRGVLGGGADSGQTWAGALRQIVTDVAAAGSHTLQIGAQVYVGQATWRFDDASVVIEPKPLAFSTFSGAFSSQSEEEALLPIKENGGTQLTFKTTTANQVVKIAYNAVCAVRAPRGTWVSIRIVVDGQEAAPASGHDFAFCSSLHPDYNNQATAFRQSVITVPTAGKHQVEIYGRASGPADWALHAASLVVR